MVSDRSAAPSVWRRFLILVAVAAGVLCLLVLAFVGYAQTQEVASPPVADDVAIIVSPHPDDETYSMGQTIAAQALSGKTVIGVLVTDGESSQLVKQWADAHGQDLNADGAIDKWDFGLARRAEYAEAMSILGVDEIVFLGTAESKGAQGFTDTGIDARELQEALAGLGDAHPGAAWFTTAPFRRERLYRGDFRNHPDHAATADAVIASAESSDGVAHLYKTYVFYLPWFLRSAPVRVAGSEEALLLKREAIEAFSTVGAMSTPELYKETMRDRYEYLVPVP